MTITRILIAGVLPVLLSSALLRAAESGSALRNLREFALRTGGDRLKGKALFENEERAACSRCHAVDAASDKPGPNLRSIGDKFPRCDLIRAILEPSAEIAIGYETSIFETTDGETVEGIVKGAGDQEMEVATATGQRTIIKRADIGRQSTSRVSMMPGGWENIFTQQEFADLVAYVESLKSPENAVASANGMPEVIGRSLVPAEFRPFFSGSIRFDKPVWFGEVPGFTNRWLVLEHFGKSWVVERIGGNDKQESFLDLTKEVRTGGATGLLGFAFHPRFSENRKYYLKYQILEENQISTVVVEREFSTDFRGDSGKAAVQLLKIPAVTQDHNGGCLEFGPDGFLYIGMGDSGPQNDPRGHGQDLGTLLGKILRIDVDVRSSERAYGIPRTNPFRNRAGARPEIWAYGFREPWRFTFDAKTKEHWVGDVGQDQFEEVSIVRGGENLGWNVFEGFVPFSRQHRQEGRDYVNPIFAYPRRLGVSVTGGYVYRGSKAPRLQGWYIFGDFESRRVWALQQTSRKLQRIVEIAMAPTRVVSFGQGRDGELFLVGYDTGIISQIDLSGVDTRAVLPKVLLASSEREEKEYRYTFSEPPAGWFEKEFDDSGWSKAAGGFGREGTPGGVVRTAWHSRDIWLRRKFTLPESFSNAGRTIYLRIHHDEDAVVYINGIEGARLGRWTVGYTDVPLSPAGQAALRAGDNIIAIHCHQQGGGQYIDAGLIEFVPDDAP